MAKCCVRGCSNKLEVGSNIRMFRFPALLDKPKSLVELSRQRRNAWLIALNRTNLPEEVLKTIGICSDHFITGSPARLKDNTEVDWIPTVRMGSQQRNRSEKKIVPPTQTNKLKLSELEKLKNELKCKDAIIKNYKDESLQLKHQQIKIVNNYEERLKEKDVKIKMGVRELHSKEIKEPHRSENHNKGRGVAMRSGRILQKKVSKQKLIKPCVVRIRRLLKVKEEPEEEISPQNSASKRNTSKQNISKENTSTDDTSNEPTSREHALRDRSVRRAVSGNRSHVNTKTELSTNKRLSRSPNPNLKKVEDLETAKPSSRKVEQSLSPKLRSKKVEEPILPKPTSSKVEESRTSKASSKKLQEPIPPKSIPRKVEELRTPNPSLKKFEEFSTPKPSSINIVESSSPMASTRTRRAPKPNPKYANDDIITPKAKSKQKEILVLNEAGFDTDSGDDFYYGQDESSETETNEDIGDAFEVNDSSDFSDSEDFLLKRKRMPKAVPFASRSNTIPAKQNIPKPKPVSMRPPPPTISVVKPVELKKPVQVSQKPAILPQQILVNRKRKLEETTQIEPPESIMARNKRLNIALYDANVVRPASPIRSSVPKQTIAISNTKVQSTQVTSILAPNRPGPLSSKVANPSAPKIIHKVRCDSPLLQRTSPAPIESSPELNDSANTQDDFETMPTFTIVNINDIINKKGDCLVQKLPEEKAQRDLSPNSLIRTNRRKAGHTTVLSEKIETVKLLKPVVKTSPFQPKTFLPKSPVSIPKTPLPLPKPQLPLPKIHVPQSNMITIPAKLPHRASILLPEKKEAKKTFIEENLSPPIEKPAPRILNSVVGKKTYPVQPILSKFDDNLDPEQTEDATEKSVMVKENIGSNKVVPTKPSQQRKLPPEKVFVQRQGNKLIKKITCFETWYVINIPETPETIVKNILDIPLITLGNSVKTVKLPSSSWSSKVTLFKISSTMMNKPNLIPYTGEISDPSIEIERGRYQPSCVMFRRMTQQMSKTRMPYDRAVIFKMKTFFTNIDGRNVRLIGAPSKISSFEDIEVLLELVDELDLLHEFVETASTV